MKKVTGNRGLDPVRWFSTSCVSVLFFSYCLLARMRNGFQLDSHLDLQADEEVPGSWD